MLDLGDDVLIAIGSVSAQWATLEYYMSRVRAALDAHGRVPKSATSDGDKAKGPAVPVAVFGGSLPWQYTRTVNFLAISHTSDEDFGAFGVSNFGVTSFTSKKFMTMDGWMAKFTF